MMDKLKKNMVFYLLLLIDFYIVPWFIKNTGSAMIVMLVIIHSNMFNNLCFYGLGMVLTSGIILIVAIFVCAIYIYIL